MSGIVELFDDFARRTQFLFDLDVTQEFLTFVRNQRVLQQKWRESEEECERLKKELDKGNEEISKYEKNLSRARGILHMEQTRRDNAEQEIETLKEQLKECQDLLYMAAQDEDKLSKETKRKLNIFVESTRSKLRTSHGRRLSSRISEVDEINSTGDLLTDLTCSMSESEIEASERMQKARKVRRSEEIDSDVPVKRRRSARISGRKAESFPGPCSENICNKAIYIKRTTHRRPRSKGSTKTFTVEMKKNILDQLVATTTVTIPPVGPVVAESRIQTLPTAPPEPVFIAPSAPPLSSMSSSSSDTESGTQKQLLTSSSAASLNRGHDFTTKTVLRSNDECCVCLQKLSFGSKAVKCNDCKTESHSQCRDGVPVPCIPVFSTPSISRNLNLSESCGKTPPYVPPIIVRCALEVERRGLCEPGIYRIPGSEKDVRSLKAQFLRMRGTVLLTHHDIHVVCGVFKDFLRSLPEPIITFALWQRFVGAISESGEDRNSTLYQLVSELPPAHRDTLAFIMLHLLKVSMSSACMMPRNNLAIVFGPTLIGYSSLNPSHHEMSSQTGLQQMLLESLFDLGEDYWRSLLNKAPEVTPLRTPMRNQYFGSRRNVTLRSFKMFSTPPNK